MRIDFTTKRNKVISFIGQRAPATRGRSHARATRHAYFYSATVALKNKKQKSKKREKMHMRTSRHLK